MKRERLRMDRGWKFHRSDVELPPVLTKDLSYRLTKAEQGYGPAAQDACDWDWETVSLPHDYAVQERPDPAENECHGYLKRDNAWYRRSFSLPETDRGKRLCLYFESAGTHCTVWVNGHLLHRSLSGNVPFEVEFGDVALFGNQPNVVSVYVDNRTFEGWYYEGCGVTGHVWLEKTPLVAIERYGVFANPVFLGGFDWRTELTTCVRNDEYEDAHAQLCATILDESGYAIAKTTGDVDVPARGSATLRTAADTYHPRLWSLEEPCRYTVQTQLWVDGSLVDETRERFGYRTARFDPDEGFFLNGKPVKLKGACVHQHHGMLGSALPDALYEMRVDRLKQMGCNSCRTSHYPQAEAFLDECDRQGMLVMDELRLFDGSLLAREQAGAITRRDRNHPSVILWCAGNEELIQATEQAGNILRAIRHEICRNDGSRPVTMAMNEGVRSNRGAAAACDVIGINYYTEYYDEVHRLNPEKPIVATELYSTAPDPHAGNVAQGVDDWRQVATRPYLSGIYIWTGLDYRGENFWPRLESSLGALDINGIPKESFYRYQAYWTKRPMAYLPGHWNHAEGETVTVGAYTNLPKAELLLNGVSLGEKDVDPFEMVQWDVPFAPGTLLLQASGADGETAAYSLSTAGEAARLCAEPYREEVYADGRDLLILDLAAEDAAGNPAPFAAHALEISVVGEGRLLSFGNGDILAHDPWPLGKGNLYAGRGQVLVQSTEKAGRVEVRITVEGLAPCVYAAHTKSRAIPLAVPEQKSVYAVRKIQISPIWGRDDAPDLAQAMAVKDPSDSCLSFWPVVVLDGHPAEKLQGRTPGRFCYGLRTVIPDAGGPMSLCIPHLRGAARITAIRYGDDERPELRRVTEKPERADQALTVDLADYAPGDDVVLFIEIDADTDDCGIRWPLYWERCR